MTLNRSCRRMFVSMRPDQENKWMSPFLSQVMLSNHSPTSALSTYIIRWMSSLLLQVMLSSHPPHLSTLNLYYNVDELLLVVGHVVQPLHNLSTFNLYHEGSPMYDVCTLYLDNQWRRAETRTSALCTKITDQVSSFHSQMYVK